MKPSLLATALLVGVLGLVPGCNRSRPSSDPAEISAEARASSSPAPAEARKYHCPMHPAYVSDRPGDCPICNMKLVPIKTGGASAAEPAASVDGRVGVEISPARQQRVGVTTTTVGKRRLRETLRATGVLEHDETVLATVAPRFAGYVTRLEVAFTGQEVTEGEPLATVYSPEVMVTELEYLVALRQEKSLGPQTPSEQRNAARQLTEAARQRLRLWGIGDPELRAIEERGEPGDSIVLRAPVSGHVVRKNAVAGKAFMAGESLYEIGRLNRLWARLSIPEDQLPRVRVGQSARIILPYRDGREIASTVEFVYPHIDPATRRAEVRLAVENPGHELRPDMWIDAELEVDFGLVLAIPASAVIDTGRRQIAFVKRPDGELVPHELKIGARTESLWQVLGGVEAGDEVVNRALFLVDAESQLEAALQGMTAGQAGGEASHGH